MKNALFLSFGLIVLLGCASTKEQQTSLEFEIPRNYSFGTADDYKKYEPDILRCIEYLENAPVNDLSDYRKRVNSFFLDWLSGVPYITITVDGSVLDLCQNNPNLLLIFMAGWTRYSLSNDDNEEIEGYLAGIENILAVYRRGNGVVRDENILALQRVQDEGKLRELIVR